MSIVTLKRKTSAKYNNMSVNSKVGFSLNGTHRNQGYVGQSVISRSIPRVNTKGHGGCCGTYVIKNNVPNVWNTEDTTVVKKSSMNNKAVIETKYMYVKRPYPYGSVKPDDTNNINTQGTYITEKAKKIITYVASCPNVPQKVSNCTTSLTKLLRRTNYNVPRKINCPIVKDTHDFTSISQGEYMKTYATKCNINDDFKFTAPFRREPFLGFN
jgi:hypothetical protein